MIETTSCARGDVIPFGLAGGQSAGLVGLNIGGMKQRNFSRERLIVVEAFYQELFRGPGIFADRLQNSRRQSDFDPAIAEILAFIDADRHRALCLPMKSGCA